MLNLRYSNFGMLVLLTVLASGCAGSGIEQTPSEKVDAKLLETIRPWGRETPENTKAFFESYQNILRVRIVKTRWVSQKPPKLSTRHYQATVSKVYKGLWKESERISFVSYHDISGPEKSPSSMGFDMIVLTNKHTQAEFPVDTGELLIFKEDLVPALQHFYP